MNVAWDYAQGTAAGDPTVRIDPAYPRAACLADPGFVTRAIAGAFGLSARSWEILHVSYVPGRELRAVYRLGGSRDPAVRVDFVPAGTAAAAYERARRRARDPRDVALIADADAVAWRVPEDERLPALSVLLEPAGASESARRALGVRSFRFDDVELLSYVPRRRAVVRCTGSPDVVAKAGRMRDEGDCHRRQLWLHHHPGRAFRLARPLGHDPLLGVRYEQAVPGASVEHLLATADLDSLVAAAAEAIAGLHRAPAPPGAPRIGAGDLLAHLTEKTLTRLTETLPPLAPRLEALVDRLRETAPASGRVVTLHGDFHPANLLIDPDGAVFVDLDNLAVGPAERDLGIFAGRLILMGLARGTRVDEVVEAALRLPEHYRRAGGTAADPGFRRYVAASIPARQIANGVRRLAPGLGALSARLLDLAEERLLTSAA